MGFCEDAGRQGPYDLVTVTDSPKRAYALTSSVQWPVRLRVLQPPAAQRPWKFKYFDAERYMLQLGLGLGNEDPKTCTL